MKTTLITLTLLVGFCIESLAQRVETIIQRRTFKLHSATHFAGGITRSVVPLQIPGDAIGIIYSIQVNPIANQAFDLAAQVGGFYMGGNAGASVASVATKILVPTNGAAADVFLLPSANDGQYFVNKNDGYWKALQSGSQLNLVGGAFGLPCTPNGRSETLYIGVRNPSSFSAVTVTLDAVALYKD